MDRGGVGYFIFFRMGDEFYRRIQRNISRVYYGPSKPSRGGGNDRGGKKLEKKKEQYIYLEQHDLLIDKYYSDLLQVLTEDEHLRVRRGDMTEFERTDIVEFMRNLKLFEQRMEKMTEQLKQQNAKK